MASPAVRCTSRETGGGSCAAPWSWAAEFCSSIAMAASTGGSPYTDANPNASSPPSRPARRPHTSRERMDMAQWQGKPRRCRPSCTSSCTFMPLKIERAPCSVLTKYMTSRNRSPANTAHGRICRTGIAGTLRGRGVLAACDMSPPRVRATRYWSGTTVEGLTHGPGGTHTAARPCRNLTGFLVPSRSLGTYHPREPYDQPCRPHLSRRHVGHPARRVPVRRADRERAAGDPDACGRVPDRTRDQLSADREGPRPARHDRHH